MDNWYNTSGSNEFYLDKKDLGDSNYEYNIYPKAVIENMMSMQGVRPLDFQKTSGLNAEKLQGEYNDYIEYLDSYYDYQGKELIDKYTKKGMSAQKVKQQLIKDGYVDEENFNKLFKDVAEGFDYKNNADKFFVGENDQKLYKADRNNKIYEYNNDTWTLVKPTKEQEANFKNMSPKDRKIFSDQGTYMSGEKLMVNGNPAFFYNASLDDKTQNTIINDYKKGVSSNKAQVDAANKQAEGSQIYSSYNNELYSHVYGTDFGNLKKINPLEIPTTAERISGINIEYPHIGYTQAYNKVVDELNAVTKNKKSTDSFEDIRKKKAVILEKFINLAGSGDKERRKNNAPSWGLLPEYNYTGTFGPSTFQTKDITAYKDKDKLASQLTFAIDNEAQNYLYQAYENNILPNAYNAHTTNYKGTNLKEKYPTFQDFVQSPEGKSFLNTYVQSPDVGKTLFNNAYNFKEKNFITDQQNKELALGRKNLAKAGDWSNFTWENATSNYGLGALDLGVDALFRYYDQGLSLISQPWNTIDQWRQGKLQDRGIGIIGDNPTERDLKNMDEKYGPGTSSAYLEKLNKIGQNPFSQITNLFNPIYYATGAGRGMGRKIVGDPDQSLVDIGENLLFAFMGTKGGSKLMNTKALSYLPKVIPRALKTSKLANALKTNKVASRIGTAATNYGTFGNGLNAYFLDHAFMPSTDSETGETVQGFGTEAFKNIYKGLTDKDGINMDMISPNLVNAYMAYSIGKHGLHNANYLSGNLLGKPALIPTLPIQNRISEGFQKFKRIPKIVKDPKSGYLKFEYEDVQFDPTIKKNNNRKGENYHQRGGIVLPKFARGKPGKIQKEKEIVPEREIEKEVTRSLENLDFTNYVNATAPETMTLIDNLKNNNASGTNYVAPIVVEKPVLPAEFVPASNLNVENDFGFSALGAEQLPAIPKAPWELQDLPGRQLKSLMSNGKIFKITEPKTGLVNLNQALGIIGQEKGAPEKLAFTRQGLADFLQQGLDQPLPEKIDFNQLRSIVQGKIVPMETQIVEHKSHYGSHRLGYPDISIFANKEKLANTESDILTIKDNILKAQAEPKEVNIAEEIKKQYPHLKEMNWPEIGYAAINRNGNIEYATTLVEAKRTQESSLIHLNNQLKERMDRFDEAKKDMEDLPLENKTLIISNKDQFGQLDSEAHNNPPETLGHVHFLRDKDTPDTATITQIQADPFQSSYYWRYNINKETRDIGNKIVSLKDQLNPEFYTSSLSEEEKIEINNKIEELKKELEPIVKENTPNYEQKVLLEASHEQRFLQEFVDYAARRGDINKIRIPTLQTAAAVQNYRPTSKNTIHPETRQIYETSNVWEEALAKHLELYPEDAHLVNDAVLMAEGKAAFDSYKRDPGQYEPKYSPKNMTILKKYIEQARNVRKLFGQDTRPVVDRKGNTFQEFDIPKSFKDLKGEIQAYEEGGSIQMDLTQDEINSYANGGWIVEDLDTYQDGGELPKARRGKSVKTRKYQFKKPLGTYTFPNVEGKVVPTPNPDATKAYWDMWNKVNQKKLIEPSVPTAPINEVPMADLENLSKTTGGNSLIQYGDEPFQGESLYHAEPTDYMGSEPGLPGALPPEEWKKQANIDAYANLKKAMANNPPYGKDLFKGLGDFNFKSFSDNWNSLQELKNSTDGPQWVPGKEDFFTNKEIENLFNQQLKFRDAARSFNEMYPEDPGMAMFNALTGNTRRDELFSNLYPNVGLPNFRSKILSTEQEKNINLWLNKYSKDVSSPSFINKSKLNPQSLKTINTGFETLPKTYQQLLESQKGNDFLQTGPAKLVVGEMRGGLGLSLEEVLNASPEQLEILRKKIVIKMGKQDLERWERDISNPFTGVNAWEELSKQAGYKNKNGGVSMKLSKDEIDKYVNGGYIVTEE